MIARGLPRGVEVALPLFDRLVVDRRRKVPGVAPHLRRSLSQRLERNMCTEAVRIEIDRRSAAMQIRKQPAESRSGIIGSATGEGKRHTRRNAPPSQAHESIV